MRKVYKEYENTSPMTVKRHIGRLEERIQEIIRREECYYARTGTIERDLERERLILIREKSRLFTRACKYS